MMRNHEPPPSQNPYLMAAASTIYLNRFTSSRFFTEVGYEPRQAKSSMLAAPYHVAYLGAEVV